MACKHLVMGVSLWDATLRGVPDSWRCKTLRAPSEKKTHDTAVPSALQHHHVGGAHMFRSDPLAPRVVAVLQTWVPPVTATRLSGRERGLAVSRDLIDPVVRLPRRQGPVPD